jgi:hypothetical protein
MPARGKSHVRKAARNRVHGALLTLEEQSGPASSW